MQLFPKNFFFFFFFLSFFCAFVMCGICVVCIACNHQHSLYSHTNFVVWSRLLLLHHPTPIPTTTTPPALGSLCMVHQVPCSAWLHPEASVGPSWVTSAPQVLLEQGWDSVAGERERDPKTAPISPRSKNVPVTCLSSNNMYQCLIAEFGVEIK